MAVDKRDLSPKFYAIVYFFNWLPLDVWNILVAEQFLPHKGGILLSDLGFEGYEPLCHGCSIFSSVVYVLL
jgi:hypothetical protein